MSDLTGSVILVVDDEPTNRRLLAQTLRDYLVLEAESGEAAFKLISKITPDLIALDINMPILNGFEVCERLQASPETADIPIIFVTGAREPGLVGKCLRAGAVDFIEKPIDMAEVMARVRTHLTLKKTRAELLEQNKLLEKRVVEQRLNSKLAGQLLDLVNPNPVRFINLTDDKSLFVNILSRSCNEEGGDHYLLKTVKDGPSSYRTIISIKDQSGHAVNCILRSIITDLLHNSTLYNYPNTSLAEQVCLLNNSICATGLFHDDDFLTAAFLELDHNTMQLKYVSAGHPSFFLIRNGDVISLPGTGSVGANLPLAFQENVVYGADCIDLQVGDRLLLYTDGLSDLPVSLKKKALSCKEISKVMERVIRENPSQNISSIMRILPKEIFAERGISDDVGGLLDSPYDDVTMIGLEVEAACADDWQIFRPESFERIDGLIDEVISYVEKYAQSAKIVVDPFKLRMVLGEGIINAWRHGNLKMPEKSIGIACRLSNDLQIFIRDEGAGFDYESLHNPTLPDNRLFTSGRGVYCMRKYADGVGWLEGGKVLVVSFRSADHPWDSTRSSMSGLKVDLWRNPMPGM